MWQVSWCWVPLNTGQLLDSAIRDDNAFRDMSFSHDGKRLLTASFDGMARVWNVATGQPLTPPMLHEDMISRAVFSPDERMVATASHDQTARLWDAVSGQPLTAPLRTEKMEALDVAFSDDGRRVVTASWGLQFWDTFTGQPVGKNLAPDRGFNRVQFSPDGHYIMAHATLEGDFVWKVSSLKPACERIAGGHQHAAFSPDGLRVITWGGQHEAAIWQWREP